MHKKKQERVGSPVRKLPQNRGHLETEQRNPRSARLDTKTTLEILKVINAEDAAVPHKVRDALPAIADFTEKVVGSLSSGGRLIYVGAGTSGRLGVLDAAECPPTFSTPPGMISGIIAGGREALVRSIEGAEDSPETGRKDLADLGLSRNDCVLGITAGSTTPYVLGALEFAREVGACTGFLSCSPASENLVLADVLIQVVVGPEVITGSTRMKAGTATKLVLNMITTTAMVRLNKTYGNLMVDLKAVNEKLWDRGTRIVAELAKIPYQEAWELLQEAEGEVKSAVVMHTLRVSLDDARVYLTRSDGSLRKALGINQ